MPKRQMFLSTPFSLFTLFCIYCFLSALWAVHISLVWFPLSILLAYWVVLYLTQTLDLKVYQSEFKKALSFGAVAMTCIIVVQLGWYYITNSEIIKGGNTNYKLSVSLVLIVLANLYEAKLVIWMSRCALLVVIILAYLFSSIGVLFVGLGILLLSFVIRRYQSNGFVSLLKLLFAVLLICMVSLFTYYNLSGDIVSAENRLSDLVSSYNMFLSSPLLGKGLGNWMSELLLYEEVDKLQGPFNFIKKDCHTYLAKVLVELGILGFMIYSAFIATVVIKYIKLQRYLDRSDHILFYTFLLYFSFSFFYYTSVSNDGFFSGVEYIAFICLGLLLNKVGMVERAYDRKIYD